MPKVKNPIKEFWEIDKKPDYLGISQRKNCGDCFTHQIKFKGLNKTKKK